MKLYALKTQSGNYLLSYKNSFFFVNLSLNKLLKESDEGEYNWLSNIVNEEEIEISESLVVLLNKANSFVEDAASLQYFKNEAFRKVYPFLNETYEISLFNLSEWKTKLLFVPNHYSYDCSRGYWYSNSDVMFFDKDKNLIGKCNPSVDCKNAGDTDYTDKGESIVEAIASQEIENEVAYILIESKSNGDQNDETISKTQHLFLVDTNLSALIEQIRKEAENGLS